MIDSGRGVARVGQGAVMLVLAGLGVIGCTALQRQTTADAAGPSLRLETVGSDSTAFAVTATLIVGPTEVLLWDAHYHATDARRLADRVAATGKRLKGVIISHPDHDHYAGAAVVIERFPGTPVWMTAAALAEFEKSAAESFASEKRRRPDLFADSLITPGVLPSLRLSVDGAVVEVIPDLAGDVMVATNSILWIPSLRAVLAGDVVFQDVHPWLAASTDDTRGSWRGSLERIAALHPDIVVAGHKKDAGAADSPVVLQSMHEYLNDFDRFAKMSQSADELVRSMSMRYSNHAVSSLLRASARRVIASRRDVRDGRRQ